jgi:ABC-type lipoprotein export system ATPase subunit
MQMTVTAPRSAAGDSARADEAGCLVAEHLELTYGAGGPQEVRALRDVSVRLEPGAYVALRGPSGSGKSSLLHCLGGLVDPTGGQVRWDGRLLSTLSTAERSARRRGALAYLFQGSNLLPTFDALEDLSFAAYLSGARSDPSELLERVALAGKSESLPDELSGGEQQRIALMRAFAQRPRVLLADEPTGQLDTVTAGRVLELLDEVRRELGLTVVLATHDPEVAARAEIELHLLDGALVPEEH